MTESDTRQSPNPPDADEALRRSLLKRVGVAAVLVAGLLAALMLFDGRPDEAAQRPAEVARAEPPVKPIERPAETAAAEAEAAPAAQEDQDQPELAAEPEHTELPVGRPRGEERPLTAPAKAHAAALRPAEPAVSATPDPRDIARAAPAGQTNATAAAAPAGEAKATAATGAPSRRFRLQMGVFNNLANAEELRARLEEAGLPAHIEARVQVGPFASRREAEQASAKLKSLGMEPGMIVAGRK